MERNEVGIINRGESEAVEEEKGKCDNNTDKDRPPKLPVHGFLGVLPSLSEVFECEVQGVECPNVKSSQGANQGQNNEEQIGT